MKEEEIWKDVVGWEGRYQVSNYGRIKSLKREIIRKTKGRREYVYVLNERIIKSALTNHGYPAFGACENSVGKTLKIHRVLALAFIPNPENKRDVNHIDGDKTNNHVSNLEWATRTENTNHAFRIGLTKTKLNSDQVLEIRASKQSERKLAKIYNVSAYCIRSARKRLTWKHVI